MLDRVAGAMELIVSNIDQSLTFHLRFQTEIEMMQVREIQLRTPPTRLYANV